MKRNRFNTSTYRKLHENNVRQGFLTDEQFQTLRSHLPQDIEFAIVFAYETGWRVPSEVLTRKSHYVDFASETIRLEPGETKNGKARVFPFTNQIRNALMNQRQTSS